MSCCSSVAERSALVHLLYLPVNCFTLLLLQPRRFQPQWNMLACRAQTLQGESHLRPARAARRRRFNRVQSGFGLGASLLTLKPRALKPRSISVKFSLQGSGIRALEVGDAVETTLDDEQIALGGCDDA